MEIKFLKRSLFQRLLGTPETQKPKTTDCWHYDAGKLVINLQEASELSVPGGAIRFEGKNLPKRVLVVMGEDGDYHAFHNRCGNPGQDGYQNRRNERDPVSPA